MNAKQIMQQAQRDFAGWGDSFVRGLGKSKSDVETFVRRVEAVEPDIMDFNSAAPYRTSSYSNACKFLGIETKYNR